MYIDNAYIYMNTYIIYSLVFHKILGNISLRIKKNVFGYVIAYIYVGAPRVCLMSCVPDVCRGHKRALNPLKLELQARGGSSEPSTGPP